ncbi:uncharacterized protein LOC125676195 [Ostrea edulis]|uniref:uncharacterized protein LOC125676195 n=1 Tax=Ostrea edulis TaxID=37623 RepID=UPI0020962829|nr:uncharacterized protein LOC125676195 [Ostrea edulis]
MEMAQQCQKAVVCEYCEENVDFWCTCGKYICEKCLGKHIKQNPKHSAAPYQERSAATSLMCEKHNAELCKLFCKECFESICMICSHTAHSDHGLISMEDHLAFQRNAMTEELQKIEKQFKAMYLQLLTEIDEKLSNAPAKYSNIRASIDHAGMALQRKIEGTVCKLKMQVETMEMEHLDSLRENKSRIQKVLEDIEGAESLIHEQMTDAKQLAVFQTTSYPFERCPKLTELIFPSFRGGNIDFNCLEFLGELVPIEKEKSSVREEETEKRDEEDIGKGIKVLKNLRNENRIETVYSYISDLSCTNDNHILVCGTYRVKKSYNIRKIDFEGKEIETIPVECQANFITEGSDGTVYYTTIENQGVKKIQNGTNETIVKDDHWTPNGVACKSSGDLIVAEQNKTLAMGRLRTYSSNGRIKQTIASCANCSGEILKNPTFVCENINGDICTSDEGNQRVAVFLSAGGLRFLYGGKSNTKNFQSFNPRGLATDCLGNILIADYFNHTVHMMNCEGRFLQYISTNKINFPYALSIVNGNRLLVGRYIDAIIEVVGYLKST